MFRHAIEQARKSGAGRPTGRRRLNLEPLESRMLLSATPMASAAAEMRPPSAHWLPNYHDLERFAEYAIVGPEDHQTERTGLIQPPDLAHTRQAAADRLHANSPSADSPNVLDAVEAGQPVPLPLWTTFEGTDAVAYGSAPQNTGLELQPPSSIGRAEVAAPPRAPLSLPIGAPLSADLASEDIPPLAEHQWNASSLPITSRTSPLHSLVDVPDEATPLEVGRPRSLDDPALDARKPSSWPGPTDAIRFLSEIYAYREGPLESVVAGAGSVGLEGSAYTPVWFSTVESSAENDGLVPSATHTLLRLVDIPITRSGSTDAGREGPAAAGETVETRLVTETASGNGISSSSGLPDGVASSRLDNWIEGGLIDIEETAMASSEAELRSMETWMQPSLLQFGEQDSGDLFWSPAANLATESGEAEFSQDAKQQSGEDFRGNQNPADSVSIADLASDSSEAESDPIETWLQTPLRKADEQDSVDLFWERSGNVAAESDEAQLAREETQQSGQDSEGDQNQVNGVPIPDLALESSEGGMIELAAASSTGDASCQAVHPSNPTAKPVHHEAGGIQIDRRLGLFRDFELATSLSQSAETSDSTGGGQNAAVSQVESTLSAAVADAPELTASASNTVSQAAWPGRQAAAIPAILIVSLASGIIGFPLREGISRIHVPCN